MKIARKLLISALLSMFAGVAAAAESAFVLAFGSCVHQDRPQLIWEQVLGAKPDVFAFLGDNIYGDSDDPDVLAAKYQQLGAVPDFLRLQDQTQVVAIWDDHDYGRNDAGIEYPSKEASRQVMLDFWGEPLDSARRTRPDGIYTTYLFEHQGKRIQLILPDLRWNRTSLQQVTDPTQLALRESQNMGPYEVNLQSGATMLGETQWQWLERQFDETADLRIIGSSLQLLAEFTGWESWANYPSDRQRLMQLLEQHADVPTLILSGDTHWSEISQVEHAGLPWPLLDITSSGLTEEWHAISPNRHRVGEAWAVANFGLLQIAWDAENRLQIEAVIRDVEGRDLIRSSIQFPTAE
jgi:alkaline phosphatase D